MNISATTILMVLTFMPGYIFIKVKDYFLLKREKSKFEATVQSVIASAIIWIAFIALPCQPYPSIKMNVLDFVVSHMSQAERKDYSIHICLLWVYVYVHFADMRVRTCAWRRLG